MVYHDLTCRLTFGALLFKQAPIINTDKTTQIQYIQFPRTSKPITYALPKSQACSHRQIYAVKQPTCLISLYFFCIITTYLLIRSSVTDGIWEGFPHSHEKTLQVRLFDMHICQLLEIDRS